MGDMKLEQLRTLDDFLLESARFQLPNGGTWGRRIKGNLLYYQTNYAILALFVIIIILMIRPAELVTGILIALIGVVGVHFATQRFVNDFRAQHPYIMSAGALAIVYLLLTLLGSVLIFVLAILIPVFLTLLHASLRLRNIRNKITNQLDKVGIKKTPMGYLLDEWGMVFDDE